MKTLAEPAGMVFFPEGKIDSDNADDFERELSDWCDENPGERPVLDFGGLEYISSAGLRVLLRLAKRFPEKILVRNVSLEIMEVLDVSGFTELMQVQKKMREISLDGLEVIGTGGDGTVYRLDSDKIVKVYLEEKADTVIASEQRLAKYAFVHGIPTAISFDIVRVGKGYGAVFEMVRAKTMRDCLAEASGLDTERELAKLYADVIRLVGSAEAEFSELPDARDVFRGYVAKLRDYIPKEESDRIVQLLDGMPENRHLLHGDLHLKNIMISDGEPMLIDMDTLCTGDPVFELAGLMVAFQFFSEEDPEDLPRFMGLDREKVREFWGLTCDEVLKDLSEESRALAMDRIALLGRIRFLDLVAVKHKGSDEFREARIAHAQSHLKELLERVDSLAISG